jgi:hypothetical protein
MSQINDVYAPLPNPNFLKCILIFYSHLYLVLQSFLIPSGFPIKTLYSFLLAHIHCTPLSDYHIIFYRFNSVVLIRINYVLEDTV